MLPEPILTLPFKLFGKTLSVHMYGLLIGVGILLCFWVLFGFAKKLRYDEKFMDFVFYNAVVSIVVGFFFAALFQAFYNWLDDPAAGFHIGQGITFIGGMIGGAACFLLIYFLFRKKYTTRLYEVLSLFPCCIFLAHGFGRVGCFFAGCCYGKVTYGPLGVKFPNLPEPVYPTQLYEAAFLFIMFGVCTWLLLKRGFRYNLPLWLFSYGIFRFAIEFMRGDPRGAFIGFLSPSQFWSIFMIAGGVALYFFLRALWKKQDEKDGKSAENNA